MSLPSRALCSFPNVGIVRPIATDGPNYVWVIDKTDRRRYVRRSSLTFLPDRTSLFARLSGIFDTSTPNKKEAHMAINPTTIEEIENALEAFRNHDFGKVAPIMLDAELEYNGGDDFTIYIIRERFWGPADGDAPFRVHAIYNDLDAFAAFISQLDNAAWPEDLLDELEEQYNMTVIAGMGDWHRGSTRLAQIAGTVPA